MDRYIAYIQNEILIILIIISLLSLILLSILPEDLDGVCISNETDVIYDDYDGRIIRRYKVVRPC